MQEAEKMEVSRKCRDCMYFDLLDTRESYSEEGVCSIFVPDIVDADGTDDICCAFKGDIKPVN